MATSTTAPLTHAGARSNPLVGFFARFVGPAALTAAGMIGAGAVATRLLAGAWFGFGLLWVALYVIPMVIVSLDSAARVAMTSGRGMLDMVRRDAVRIAVGKRGRSGGEQQARIHELMIEHARAGARVLRLKGGDPLIFGRLGEEVDALLAARVPFRIVPGISAANGCAALAGIPLTERTVAQSVRFVTARLGGGEPNVDWPELAKPGQTLVIYMGGQRMASIFEQLRAHGRAAGTPVAVIESGTLPEERVQVTDLALSVPVLPSGPGPVLLIIGEVVNYRGRVLAAQQEP